MPRLRLLAVSTVAVSCAALALAGCTSSDPGTAASATVFPSAAASVGELNGALAYQSAWHVEATSRYVNGSADLCDLNLAISIEDAAALANSDTNVPVFGFVAREGQISYGTVWPTAEPGTGVVAGSGTYTMSYDGSGLPTVAHGTAKLSWHDKRKKPATSTLTDRVTLTFSQEPRADFCP